MDATLQITAAVLLIAMIAALYAWHRFAQAKADWQLDHWFDDEPVEPDPRQAYRSPDDEHPEHKDFI